MKTMKAIERMKTMQNDGWVVITNIANLESKFAGVATGEIKKTRPDKTKQFPQDVQHELSLRGDKTAFVEFHRYMFALIDGEILKLAAAMKQFVYKERLSEDEYTYSDQRILEDAIHYHLCVRFDRDFSVQIADQIARHFRQECKIAQDYQEVTSELLITFAKNLLEKHPYLTTPELAMASGVGASRIRQIVERIPGGLKDAAGWKFPSSAVEYVKSLPGRGRPTKKV
jgi:hypothetical protein